MLQNALAVWDRAKTSYLALRKDNPVMLTGDFNLKLHLHRKNTPEQATNACADGKISVALIDICAIGAIVSAVSLLCGIFAFAGYVVKKIFD